MLWFAVWAVLVVGAAAVMFLLGRQVFRKGVAAAAELGQASERLTAISEQVRRLTAEPELPAAAAVFDDPARLRRERAARRRAARRRRRRRR